MCVRVCPCVLSVFEFLCVCACVRGCGLPAVRIVENLYTVLGWVKRDTKIGKKGKEEKKGEGKKGEEKKGE